MNEVSRRGSVLRSSVLRYGGTCLLASPMDHKTVKKVSLMLLEVGKIPKKFKEVSPEYEISSLDDDTLEVIIDTLELT
jgi:hypothetical protein